ncbi:MAG: leucine-rich repeat domain-containing protein [Treponema sp.]|nr:leucine-rich repeat domain-containing protein [Treponema sp.]
MKPKKTDESGSPQARLITTIDEILPYLELQAGTIINPAPLRLALDLGTMNSGWQQILDALETAGKYVDLDLSSCTMSGTAFNPQSSIVTGKAMIVSIALPDTAIKIADGNSSSNPTFNHFTNLKSFSGDGLTSIGYYAFQSCKNLAMTSLPEGITSISGYAFFGCTNLALTSLPEGITLIDDSAFYNCTSLALTSLPESLTSIVGYAFNGCTNLTQISLSAGFTSIGNEVFRNCSNLALVTCLAETPPTLGTSVFGLTHASLQIKVPASSVDDYKAAANWSTYATRIVAMD